MNPEVLQINIYERDGDQGEYANKYLAFSVDWEEYAGKTILAVPRCCQLRKGTTYQLRVNDCVKRRDEAIEKQEFRQEDGWGEGGWEDGDGVVNA